MDEQEGLIEYFGLLARTEAVTGLAEKEEDDRVQAIIGSRPVVESIDKEYISGQTTTKPEKDEQYDLVRPKKIFLKAKIIER